MCLSFQRRCNFEICKSGWLQSLALRSIEPAPRFLDGRTILPSPQAEVADGLEQGTSELCELVIDARRNRWEDGAADEPVPFETLSVKVSIRCEMLPSARRTSLKRFGPSPSTVTTSTVHLSPTRASTSLTARQSSGTWRFFGISDVPSCVRRLVIYLALVSKHN